MAENTAIEKSDKSILETVLLQGDLSKLTPTERVNYYKKVCESIGINPLTRPFDYITLNGKLTLYAKKDCTDQLRNLHNVSIDDVDIQETPSGFLVKVKGHDETGRSDVEIGVVSKNDMQGKLENVQMKAVTKAKRRLTLSICGLGFLDETEIETIPEAKIGEPVALPEPKFPSTVVNGKLVSDSVKSNPDHNNSPEQNKIMRELGYRVEDEPAEPEPPMDELVGMSLDAAKALTITDKGKTKMLGELTAKQLAFLIENSQRAEVIEASKIVLEHKSKQEKG
jgi:hypothetical protein